MNGLEKLPSLSPVFRHSIGLEEVKKYFETIFFCLHLFFKEGFWYLVQNQLFFKKEQLSPLNKCTRIKGRVVLNFL